MGRDAKVRQVIQEAIEKQRTVTLSVIAGHWRRCAEITRSAIERDRATAEYVSAEFAAAADEE